MKKLFPLILAAAALLSCAREISPEAVLTCVQPPALQPGDKIVITGGCRTPEILIMVNDKRVYYNDNCQAHNQWIPR